MKITGSMNYIKFDMENGYVLKAEGEILVGRKFVVYTNTINCWEKPHEKERVTKEQLEKIVHEVKDITDEHTVQIVFE